mgnify:CR=1 FL=1
MRLNGQKQGKRKGGVICFNGAFHGRTMGAQMMTGNNSAKEWAGYQDPNIHHLNFPYPWEVENPKDFFEFEIEKLLKDKNFEEEEFKRIDSEEKKYKSILSSEESSKKS